MCGGYASRKWLISSNMLPSYHKPQSIHWQCLIHTSSILWKASLFNLNGKLMDKINFWPWPWQEWFTGGSMDISAKRLWSFLYFLICMKCTIMYKLQKIWERCIFLLTILDESQLLLVHLTLQSEGLILLVSRGWKQTRPIKSINWWWRGLQSCCLLKLRSAMGCYPDFLLTTKYTLQVQYRYTHAYKCTACPLILQLCVISSSTWVWNCFYPRQE